MTTPGGVFIRRSEFDDQPGIQALIGQEAEQVAKRFRHVDVTNMIENASLGITAVDEKGAVVGYAAVYDFPALTSEVDPGAWPEWLPGAFGHPDCDPSADLWELALVRMAALAPVTMRTWRML